MAIYDGKNIRGSIGNVSFRKRDKNTTTVQSKPGKNNMNQTAATKKSASVFGQVVSPLAKHLRICFKSLVHDFYDQKMVNRMNSDIGIIVNQHLEENGKVIFNETSFNRLTGFEFNSESPLNQSLLLSPKVVFNSSQVQLTIPAFKVHKQLKFPIGANRVWIEMQPVFICLEKGLWFKPAATSLQLEKGQGAVDEQCFTYAFPKGTACMIGIKTLFFDGELAINKKNFNPVGILASAFNEGKCDETELSNWYKMGVKR